MGLSEGVILKKKYFFRIFILFVPSKEFLGAFWTDDTPPPPPEPAPAALPPTPPACPPPPPPLRLHGTFKYPCYYPQLGCGRRQKVEWSTICRTCYGQAALSISSEPE